MGWPSHSRQIYKNMNIYTIAKPVKGLILRHQCLIRLILLYVYVISCCVKLYSDSASTAIVDLHTSVIFLIIFNNLVVWEMNNFLNEKN
jgi:hypothetical protein